MGWKNWFIVAVILMLGFLLRFHDLGEESIWLDEASSLKFATTAQKDVGHPPVYYALLCAWVGSFGTSEFSLRLPSLVFGVLSVLVLYLVVNQIFNRKTALISSFLMSISVFQIVYSQDARSYTLLSLLTLLSALFFIRIVKNGKVLDYLLYAVILIVANYTHFLAILLIPAYNFIFYFILETDKNQDRKWLLSNLIIIAAILPLFFSFLRNLPRLYSDFRNLAYLAGMSHGLFHLISVLAGIVLAVVLIFLLSTLYKKKSAVRNSLHKFQVSLHKSIARKQGHYLLILFLLFIAWLIAYLNVLDFFMSPYGQFVVRYSFFLAPLWYVLLALAVSKIKSRNVALFSILLFALVGIFSLHLYYTSTTKEEWNDAAFFLEEHGRENEVILVDASYMIGPLNYYYNGNLLRIPLKSSTDTAVTEASFATALNEVPSAEGFWLVLSHNWRSGEYYKQQMDQRFMLVREKHYKDIDVYYYRNYRKSL